MAKERIDPRITEQMATIQWGAAEILTQVGKLKYVKIVEDK